ncbi:MAG: response regulator [Gemmatimonadales bacterium]|nr:response regulator [Gemmatimonadales bacterium]
MPKLLIVEDNELNRDMLSRRLTRRGYDVVLAVDGGEGVAMAEAERPDLILLDMSLPVLDGWEVARRIKGSDTTRDIPIVALTAHAMAGDEARARSAGCDDFDTKPVDLERLLGKIESWLKPVTGAPGA